MFHIIAILISIIRVCNVTITKCDKGRHNTHSAAAHVEFVSLEKKGDSLDVLAEEMQIVSTVYMHSVVALYKSP